MFAYQLSIYKFGTIRDKNFIFGMHSNIIKTYILNEESLESVISGGISDPRSDLVLTIIITLIYNISFTRQIWYTYDIRNEISKDRKNII